MSCSDAGHRMESSPRRPEGLNGLQYNSRSELYLCPLTIWCYTNYINLQQLTDRCTKLVCL